MAARSRMLLRVLLAAGALAPARASALEPPAPVTVPQSTPSPSPVPAPSLEEAIRRRVTVDIESTKPATVLERRISLNETDGFFFFLPYHASQAVWEQVCVTPCKVDLDRFSSYRVGKFNGVLESRSFTLPQTADPFQIHIEPGNLIVRRVGIASTAIGSAAFIVGAALVAGERLFTDETAARNAGLITGGAGIVLLAVGIPLTILSATKVFGLGGRMALSPRGLLF